MTRHASSLTRMRAQDARAIAARFLSLAAGAAIGWSVASAATPAATPASAVVAAPTRTLVTRLQHAGRAEATLVQIVADPLGGPPARRSGRVSLELPDRVRLDFGEPAESITLRDDGGEWLQPRLQQMLTFGPAGAGAATMAWDLLLGRSTHRLRSEAVGPGRWRMHPSLTTSGLPDSAEVALDRDGLPIALIAWLADGASVTYQMSGWRFTHARGRPAFVLAAPSGFETIAVRP